MAFSFSLRSKHKEKTILVVDIGSASVGVALVALSPKKNPHILLSEREEIPSQPELSAPKLRRAMEGALGRALRTIGKNLRKHHYSLPARVVCTLSAPWSLEKTRHIITESESLFVVTERMVDDILEVDMGNLKQELSGTLPTEDIFVFERRVLGASLDGYQVSSPFGRKTTRLDTIALFGVSSKKVMDGIVSYIGRVFHTKQIEWSSFSLASFSAIRDIFPHEKDFLLLDITGEATTVSLIKNDLLDQSLFFPRGRNTLIRELSLGMNVPHEAAGSLFKMYLRGTLNEQKHEQVKRILKESSQGWVSRLEKTLTALHKEGNLPHTVFFNADKEVAQFYHEILSEIGTGFGGAFFFPRYVDPQVFRGFITSEEGISRDPFLVIGALLASKLNTQ